METFGPSSFFGTCIDFNFVMRTLKSTILFGLLGKGFNFGLACLLAKPINASSIVLLPAKWL